MKYDQTRVAGLITQLLAKDNGDTEHKRRCLIRILMEPSLALEALAILKGHSVPIMRREFKDLQHLPEPNQLAGKSFLSPIQVILKWSEEPSDEYPIKGPAQFRLSEEVLYEVLQAVHQFLQDWGSSDSTMKRVYQAVLQIPRAWALTEDEMAGLFPQEHVISHMLDIFIALNVLIPNHQALGWLKKPNDDPLFSGEPPIKVMVQGRLREVRNYLFTKLSVRNNDILETE